MVKKFCWKLTFSVQQIVEQYLSQVFGGTKTENTKRRLTPTLKVWALNHKIVGYNSNISTIENAPPYCAYRTTQNFEWFGLGE